jgi:hypothetical protein
MTQNGHTTYLRNGKIALLGYCVESMEAAAKLQYEFVVVVPPDYAPLLERDGIPAIPWEFGRIDEKSHRLVDRLAEQGVRVAVPLYEETVEWAGALNAQFRDDPRVFNRSLLFRDKAMMKRKAQMSGIRVGVFEEVDSRTAVRRFFTRVNEALSVLEGEEPYPVHLKPVSAAGSVGHEMLRSPEEIDELGDDIFPCLVESHLNGQEFSCEVFVHNSKIRFLNINEYIHLGHSQLLPPTPSLEEVRPRIRNAVEKLVHSFGVRYGILHPEYFLDQDGELNFGEVAARIPGGHIFELIERAYGFDAFAGQILCTDPQTTEEELEEFFPDEIEGRKGHAGNLLVYPKKPLVHELQIPKELEQEPYFIGHNLFEPVTPKVRERVGFGDHYGKVDFFGEDADRMREVLLRFEEMDFYA